MVEYLESMKARHEVDSPCGGGGSGHSTAGSQGLEQPDTAEGVRAGNTLEQRGARGGMLQAWCRYRHVTGTCSSMLSL